jgi:hypothetical protein
VRAFEFTGVAIGDGQWKTVDLAKPTKEDKTRRKAKKTQRKSDKERAAGARRDRNGVGELIDSREPEIQKKTSTNRLPESREMLPRARSRNKVL